MYFFEDNIIDINTRANHDEESCYYRAELFIFIDYKIAVRQPEAIAGNTLDPSQLLILNQVKVLACSFFFRNSRIFKHMYLYKT